MRFLIFSAIRCRDSTEEFSFIHNITMRVGNAILRKIEECISDVSSEDWLRCLGSKLNRIKSPSLVEKMSQLRQKLEALKVNVICSRPKFPMNFLKIICLRCVRAKTGGIKRKLAILSSLKSAGTSKIIHSRESTKNWGLGFQLGLIYGGNRE